MSDLIPLPSIEPPAPRAEVVPVPFLDGHIPCVEIDGEPMVILRPIADAIGLHWAAQYTKLTGDPAACVSFIETQLPGDDQTRRVMAVSLETFTVWLARLQPSRVKAAARDTVIAYQREAGRALRAHFFGPRTDIARSADTDLDVIQNMLDGMRRQREELRAQQARTAVLEAKVQAIEGRHDHFTALGYAKLTDRPTDRPYLSRVGAKATRIMRSRGEQPQRRQDATFGTVNVYPADVLERAFEEVAR